MEIDYIKTHPDAIEPKAAHDQDLGFDLYACEHVRLLPFERKLIDTGISMAIPDGYGAKILDRSGMAYKNGLITLAGVIDAPYRGSIKVLLWNIEVTNYLAEVFAKLADRRTSAISDHFGLPGAYTVKPGDRIAQIVFLKKEPVEFNNATTLSETNRGDGGFGSTGR